MRILVADDDTTSRLVLSAILKSMGHEAVAVADGWEAISVLRQSDAPLMALLDWEMPKMNGPEICRRVRDVNKTLYIILITAKSGADHVVEGLDAGADDYLVKPVGKEELAARVRVGIRVIQLQANLAARVKQLEDAGLEVRPMSFLI